MQRITRRLNVWARICVSLLLIPLIAMQFVDGWNWTGMDFTFAFVMWFGSAFVYEMITKNVKNRNYRIAIGAIVFLILATIWVILATG